MKKIVCLILGFIFFFLFGSMSVTASDIVITGNSVFRKSATEASVNFISNAEGDIYYLVNENQTANIDEILESAGNIAINETGTINIPAELLSSGAKYVHIVVKDGLNKCSNILTISMPKDIYYFDDFESYNINSYPDFFQIRHNGSDSSKQIITKIDGNNVFNGYGTYGVGLDERIQISPLLTGYAVLEADISALNIPTEYYFGGIVIGGNYSNDSRNVIVQVHQRNRLFFARSHSSIIVFEGNKKYHVKIIVDIENDRYDYYIDGVKANTTPVNAESYDQLTWFGIYNGNGNVQYDNIKFYSQDLEPKTYSITKDSEINGTFTIDKQFAEKDDIITIIPKPEIGYRVKSININNNESGITSNDSNYTFKMPEEDVVIKVDFEKIKYKIEVNSDIGATVSQNGIINVEYGSNKEITITPNTGYNLTSVKVNGIEKLPLIGNKVRISDITEDKEVVIKTEKKEYKIEVNSDIGATVSQNGIINVEYGSNKEITITPNTGYNLTSVKVNGIEKLPLIDNKVRISDITEDKEVVVKTEKIEYGISDTSDQKHTIGEDKTIVFRINADKSLFNKVYLNNQELNSDNYIVTAGSTIITLKKDFLNSLLPGTYNLRITFNDGGNADTTFLIEPSPKKGVKTGNLILISTVIVSILIISLFIMIFNSKRKNKNK